MAPVHTTEPHSDEFRVLALGALGVVFGDIGTSPIYAVREAFAHHLAVNEANVLGVLSLTFWALVLVICTKYVALILRADLHGEGGVLALTVQVAHSGAARLKLYPLLMALGIFGTSLLFGDGIITPAISVLSAVEGLKELTTTFEPMVLPLTISILLLLFLAQSSGTEAVGNIFGPVMLLWFGALAALGLWNMGHHPAVWKAVNPLWALSFVWAHKVGAFVVIGSVFLVVTGGEGLYADMGHFGAKPIRYAWFFLVFPALLLNYAGQGALLLAQPDLVTKNLFFQMAPEGLLRGCLVVLATGATVIASQAMISGVFSLTMQAVQMGFVPRQRVLQTSAHARGQIYVPLVNWGLMLACIGLVVVLRTSSNLAAVYGIAVTTTMIIDSILFTVLTVYGWNWPVWRAGLMCLVFLSLELLFFAGNAVKMPDGGWIPLTAGALVYIAMSTWRRGRQILRDEIGRRTLPFEQLIQRIQTENTPRVPGTAVFMYSDPTRTPPALLSNFKHNRVLHERVLFVGVSILDQPYIFSSQRAELQELGHGFYLVRLKFGFMDKLNVPDALSRVNLGGLPVSRDATYFLGKETVIPRHEKYSGMPYWREALFASMSRNSQDATAFFHLPPDRVIEMGTQVEI